MLDETSVRTHVTHEAARFKRQSWALPFLLLASHPLRSDSDGWIEPFGQIQLLTSLVDYIADVAAGRSEECKKHALTHSLWVPGALLFLRVFLYISVGPASNPLAGAQIDSEGLFQAGPLALARCRILFLALCLGVASRAEAASLRPAGSPRSHTAKVPQLRSEAHIRRKSGKALRPSRVSLCAFLGSRWLPVWAFIELVAAVLGKRSHPFTNCVFLKENIQHTAPWGSLLPCSIVRVEWKS